MSAAELSIDLIRKLSESCTSAELPERIQHATGLDQQGYLRAMSALIGMPSLSSSTLGKLTPEFELLPFAECEERQCLLMQMPNSQRVLVIADPLNTTLRRWATQRLRPSFTFALTHPDILQRLLQKMGQSQRAMDQVEIEADTRNDGSGPILDISLASIAQDTNPVVKFVNSTLHDAHKSKASDIHFESSASGLHVKYRIDGVLLPASDVQGNQIAEHVVSRLKVLAELDISERRIPQDGRFKVLINRREVDFRVSIMPSIYGEDAVLRILDKQGMGDTFKELKLDVLGLDADVIDRIRGLAREPYGLFLVTGPTGSGKSTTLYAALSEINDGSEKIITIEDPVEYQLPGILQIPVNDKKGLTFARGLRSILRHDPDKILVGEIRDAETAAIAIQAAQTGHLVFASVHANNVFSVLDRFAHMGIDNASFVDALIGVAAQRLIRKNCPHCTAPDQPTAELLATSKLTPTLVSKWRFMRGRGCERCRGTGYLGRKAIAEVLRMNQVLKEALIRDISTVELVDLACKQSFKPLRHIALRAVARGETTLEEVNRVTVVD